MQGWSYYRNQGIPLAKQIISFAIKDNMSDSNENALKFDFNNRDNEFSL